MQSVPLLVTPSQVLSVALGGQSVQLAVYQKLLGMYMDVQVNNSLIIGGVICQDRNRIVRSLYLGFLGDLMFYDNQGLTDPVYTGLGTRYTLLYLELTDLPNGVG
jgi:hypothetical protein